MTIGSHGRPAAITASFRKNTASLLVLALALCLPAAGTLAAPARGAPSVAANDTPVGAVPVRTGDQPLQAVADAVPATAPAAPAPAAAQEPQEQRAVLAPAPAWEAERDGGIGILLQKALTLLGTPYRWGGTDPAKGFDCSGLVGYVFRNTLGIELPRVSRDMARSGEPVTDRAELAAGDLVFFGLRGRINHVGIYLGEGRFLHAPSRGKDVRVSSLDQGYWGARFLQARRVGTDGI